MQIARSAFAASFVASSLAVSPVAWSAPGVPKTVTPKKIKTEGFARVVTAMSTPLKSGHPILFLNGTANGVGAADPLEARLQFPADQKYSKWSVIFDAPLRIENVEVQTCEGTKPFSDGVELYVDYSEKRLYSDGGRKVVKFNVKADARALTLGFLESAGLCLAKISIQTSTEWLRPRTIEAKGSAVVADGALGIGTREVPDGKKQRLQGERKVGEWNLQWENPLIVEGLRIWNGNQNVGDAFETSDRVRELDVKTDASGKTQRFTLADRRDPQQIELKDPQEIRSIDLKSVSSYSGKITSEPLLAEVQLTAGGENWIPIVTAKSSSLIDAGESAESSVIREWGYGDVLDRELRMEERGDIWKFRFRSDGTFFARIFVEKARTARGWSVTGTWRLGERPVLKPETKSSASKSLVRAFAKSGGNEEGSAEKLPGLALILSGTKMATSEANDSLPCASHCFPLIGARAPNSQREQPVSEQVELQRERRSVFILRNRTAPENRSMEFTDLKLRIHSLYD